MKAKSDYLTEVLGDDGLKTLFEKLAPGISVNFDAYGAAIRGKTDSETAFVHRQNVLCSIQYHCSWSDGSDSAANIERLRVLHDAMQPFVSGGAYVNYCDLDLKNWQQAYWGNNLQRLKQIKTQVDPHNVFRHAQSVPPL